MLQAKLFGSLCSLFLINTVPSEIAVSAHPSSKTLQIIMTANTGLFGGLDCVITRLTHSFAIVKVRMMRTFVDNLALSGFLEC